MEPSLSKQDIEGLKRDIPKFFGHMPSRQREFWETTLEKSEDLMLQGSTTNWALDKLKNPRRPGIAGRAAIEEIPADISQLREKETAPLEGVDIINNQY